MAERRMFAKNIIDSDAFIDMPVTARLLYYDLSMRADDDGFVNSPKKIMRMIGASEDDLKILLAKQFIIAFETGIIVIKHWRIHNYIRKDTYHKTLCPEATLVTISDTGEYILRDEPVTNPSRTRDEPVTPPSTQVRLGKDRLGKDRLGENIEGKTKRFTPPTLDEVKAYCLDRKNGIDPQHFIDYYTSNGWKVGKNPMKDWKATIRTWEKNGYSKPHQEKKQQSYDLDEWERYADDFLNNLQKG